MQLHPAKRYRKKQVSSQYNNTIHQSRSWYGHHEIKHRNSHHAWIWQHHVQFKGNTRENKGKLEELFMPCIRISVAHTMLALCMMEIARFACNQGKALPVTDT